MVVFHFDKAIDAGEGTKVGRETPLVEQNAVGFRAGITGRATEFFFLAKEVRSGHHVVRASLPVEFGVVVIQERPVRGLADANDLDVVAAKGSPKPELVLDQRSADIKTPVEDSVDAVGFPIRVAGHRDAAVRLERIGNVVRLELVAAQVTARRRVEGVGAALGDEVQADAPGHHREIVAAGVNLDLVEGIEVVVARRATAARGVSDDDTVVGVDVVGGGSALAGEDRLLSCFVARDADAVNEDTRHRLQDGPGVA